MPLFNSNSIPTMPMPMPVTPRGTLLRGNHVVFDVDVKVHSRLEVSTPITNYIFDPQPILGRQIAVNNSYICYGLKQGAVRVLNLRTALRSLLRGHTKCNMCNVYLMQRIVDMAFFAEDVHLLASGSICGRICVWKINEGLGENDKAEITEEIVLALQLIGEEEETHSRVCWHFPKQGCLVVGYGKYVLKIDMGKIGKDESFSITDPLICPVENLIGGVQLVGMHDSEVTDLSMCQWMTNRLVSASKDGTVCTLFFIFLRTDFINYVFVLKKEAGVKIWEDQKALPLVVLRPHDGQPVNSAIFFTTPHRPDHINLITAGPLNRQVKIWAIDNGEGWLLGSEIESWHCTQTLELKSDTVSQVETAFFNQVVALPDAGLVLLANAKKNAIYAVHIEYGPNPATTRMNYLAVFTVTMPILSLVATRDYLPQRERTVQVYCVQTRSIQEYALYLSQCLPPAVETVWPETAQSNVSFFSDTFGPDDLASVESLQVSSYTEMPPASTGITEVLRIRDLTPESTNATKNASVASLPLPSSPRVSLTKLSSFKRPCPSNCNKLDTQLSDHHVGNQPVNEYSIDGRVHKDPTSLSYYPSLDGSSTNDEKKVVENSICILPNPSITFKHPTHLITPSEILSTVTSSSEDTLVMQGTKEGEPKTVKDVEFNSDVGGVKIDLKVVGETGFCQNDDVHYQRHTYSLHGFVGMAKESYASSTSETFISKIPQISPDVEEEIPEFSIEVPEKVSELATIAMGSQTMVAALGGEHNLKSFQVSGASSAFPSLLGSRDSFNGTGTSSRTSSKEAAFSQIYSMQDTLNQLMSIQKEMQNQMKIMVADPVTKEGKRIEAALGRSMCKAIKANTDALLARLLEENAKREKLERDRTEHLKSLISNYMNRDVPAMLERTFKKEIGTIGQSVARLVSPAMERTIASSITDLFQRGVGDKAVSQLEKSVGSKIESTVARQIQTQFQTCGKQVLQEALKSCLQASVIPKFEMSCKAMFDQVDTAFRKGMVEHTSSALQQFDSLHSPLALSLKETINSASSILQAVTGELAGGQRKLIAVTATGVNSKVVNPMIMDSSNGTLGGHHEMAITLQEIEAPLDPTKELLRLISERKFEEAFTSALYRNEVSIVSWLCSQVDLPSILLMVPPPMSQGVLLALLQQLAYDIGTETSRKLTWMKDVAVAINPADPRIVVHVRSIFEQVCQLLGHHCTQTSTTAGDARSIRFLMHVINSMLMSCK
ncbi:hypothetical protein GIB67_039983 [Kingdonia uniflora]|uniref:Enhancer of mRNA-decapping protein 4 C-terminal domain-containing protein n=1 Tax=Kingdonia uniflora TaxID=39325 RepID=A0A7J7LI02_9MAGN|nr:hypothetical protein GIB67_039983 [Kingdonia uniflora]